MKRGVRIAIVVAVLIVGAATMLLRDKPEPQATRHAPPRIELAQDTPTPAPTPGCKLQIRPPVKIEVSAARWPHIADHVADVRKHYREVLHLDRAGADENRSQSLAGFPTRKGYDRDEYPPALSAEGGEGANVRYVIASENRSQGSVMGNALEPYCNGTHFEEVPVP